MRLINPSFEIIEQAPGLKGLKQAIERAGTKAGNKGYDCAMSAIEMVNLIREIEE